MTRIRSALLGFAAALALIAGTAFAQSDYPSRTVRIVVPFATGGPADNYARFIAQRLQDEFKQSFIVDNKPGAGSIIGTDLAAKAAADGYTLLMMSNTHTVNESLLPSKPFSLMSDFVPVAPVNASDLLLVVHPSVPVKTVAELIALAKAEPGRLNYASSGNGTPYHMAGELFKHLAGVEITHVPYKGSSGARNDTLGGQVQMMFDAETTMSEFARAGRVRGLATTGTEPSANLPELPTVSKTVPGYEAAIWLGLMAPKGTPPEVVERLNVAVRHIVAEPQVRALWARQGAQPMSMTAAQFGRFLTADIAKWGAIVKAANLKPD